MLFRDYLHQYPEQAKAYEAHKLVLAEQFDDTNLYAHAKTEFCRGIDKLAFHSEINIPFVQTERFAAYIPQLACLEEYTKMHEDPDFIACYGVAFTENEIAQRLESDMNHWDQHGFGPWMWYDKHTGQYVGRVGIKTFQDDVELAYAIQSQYWGQGVAQALGRLAIDYAFNQLGLKTLVCFTHEDNQQSLRVMEKLGFKYEKDFKREGYAYIFKYYRRKKASVI